MVSLQLFNYAFTPLLPLPLLPPLLHYTRLLLLPLLPLPLLLLLLPGRIIISKLGVSGTCWILGLDPVVPPACSLCTGVANAGGVGSRRGQAEEEEELHTEEEEEVSWRSASRGEEERSGRHVNQEARSLAPPDG